MVIIPSCWIMILQRGYEKTTSWLYTVVLFIKSDIKTTIIPIVRSNPLATRLTETDLFWCLCFQTTFAFANISDSPSTRALYRAPHTVLWLTIHLLQCTLANQCVPTAIAEDKINKPTRPIPSGRISVENAVLLRWTTLPICIAVSFAYGNTVVAASATLSVFIFIYNELGYSSHWAARNCLNGLAFAAFEAGATAIINSRPGERCILDETAIAAVLICATVFATTIFAQDFKDIEGDALIGRRTVPMLLSATAARTLLMILMGGWSIYLVQFWQLKALPAIAYLGCAAVVGGRFMWKRSVRDDQVSFYLYNVSVCVMTMDMAKLLWCHWLMRCFSI